MPESLEQILAAWNLEHAHIEKNQLAAGSPNRVLHRWVISQNEQRYVLEQLPLAKQTAREREARILHELQQQGVPYLSPWIKTDNNAFGLATSGSYWQLRGWVDSLPLDQYTYGNDGWRGQAAANFLHQLHLASQHLQDNTPVFYLSHYLPTLLSQIRQGDHRLYEKVLPILEELRDFFLQEERLPLGFCHGDFHPINILWGKGSIQGVIDWEFCGKKPILYDAANLLGCLGFENPDFLVSEMAIELLNGLRSWMPTKALPAYMIALRFGWIREWFFTQDKELLDRELAYLQFLLRNRSQLENHYS